MIGDPARGALVSVLMTDSISRSFASIGSFTSSLWGVVTGV